MTCIVCGASPRNIVLGCSLKRHGSLVVNAFPRVVPCRDLVGSAKPETFPPARDRETSKSFIREDGIHGCAIGIR